MRASEGNPRLGCSAGRRASVPQGPGSGSGSPPGAGAGIVAEQGMGQTVVVLPACVGVATGDLHHAGDVTSELRELGAPSGAGFCPRGKFGIGICCVRCVRYRSQVALLIVRELEVRAVSR